MYYDSFYVVFTLHIHQNFLNSRYEFNLKDNEAENQFELDLACPRLALLYCFIHYEQQVAI